MASCGISVNLSALETSISAHISEMAGKAPLMGIPFMQPAIVAALAISISGLTALILTIPIYSNFFEAGLISLFMDFLKF